MSYINFDHTQKHYPIQSLRIKYQCRIYAQHQHTYLKSAHKHESGKTVIPTDKALSACTHRCLAHVHKKTWQIKIRISYCTVSHCGSLQAIHFVTVVTVVIVIVISFQHSDTLLASYQFQYVSDTTVLFHQFPHVCFELINVSA